MRHIKNEAPDLSWLYLQYTDDVGHALGDSEPLRQAVADMDNLLSELWQTIISRADAHNEDWLVLVTTDHGRDAKTGKHHGAQSARERTIWIAANHPQLDTSKVRDAAMVDILPTLLEHLQIKAPTKVAEQLDGCQRRRANVRWVARVRRHRRHGRGQHVEALDGLEVPHQLALVRDPCLSVALRGRAIPGASARVLEDRERASRSPLRRELRPREHAADPRVEGLRLAIRVVRSVRRVELDDLGGRRLRLLERRAR